MLPPSIHSLAASPSSLLSHRLDFAWHRIGERARARGITKGQIECRASIGVVHFRIQTDVEQ